MLALLVFFLAVHVRERERNPLLWTSRAPWSPFLFLSSYSLYYSNPLQWRLSDSGHIISLPHSITLSASFPPFMFHSIPFFIVFPLCYIPYLFISFQLNLFNSVSICLIPSLSVLFPSYIFILSLIFFVFPLCLIPSLYVSFSPFTVLYDSFYPLLFIVFSLCLIPSLYVLFSPFMIHSIPYFLLYSLFASFHHSMFHSLHLCFILSLTFSYCVPSLLYSNPVSVILSQFILNFLPL